MILETIITSIDHDGKPHVAPFGVRLENENIIISPYKPSHTLENILASNVAVMSNTDDVRVFAGALTGRQPWTLIPTKQINGFRLKNCLAHTELQLLKVRDDALRPQLVMQQIISENHAAFKGFNRAQAAVLELAVLVSRLDRLPKARVESELQYLQIAIDKTAGEIEHEAWSWLIEKIQTFYKNNANGIIEQ